VDVLRQCGLRAADVDGLCGSIPSATRLQATLGIPEVTWYANPVIPFVNHLAAAAAAVHSGLCEVVLAYHVAYRMAWNTLSALKDPFRRGLAYASGGAGPAPEDVSGAVGYTAWASRYMHEFGVPKEHFGYVAINDRSNAARNPAAALRDPITMDDYLAARMIRWPLCLLDMDLPVDGALALGMVDHNEEDQQVSLRDHGQHVVVEALRAKGDFWIDDVDVYFPYDGFTAITLNWIENVGWCGPGEAGAFIEQHWDAEGSRILIDSRIPVNPHGGSLSEGATQGSGHLREAVHQLQARAGDRQVEGARRAIVTAGGFFFNAQGVTLRVD
jgi:acetyl-CoA acetyltransferase